ncbi:M42 family metallopeptidase [Bacillus sp. N1-1]|jgi:tetrahedral aminopeptidase|uniref:M42 family metallopeptidase n=1 Tax=Bacillus sp. N1-1 TaxID=2682541 RepID=UPI001319B1C2|nr:M42 family metallopeptidase [Bacillus sp. N1-1]QHA93037.1 M20/M25/M40 family metallo-hydrolase [Bacillus sp. N1-1]
MFSLLKELCDTIGPSGFEQNIQRKVFNLIKEEVDECKVDPLGNIIAKMNGNPEFPSLMIAAHSDEIGFVVKKIESNGLIRFEQVGGFDNRLLLSQPVFIKSDNGPVHGVIGTISAHYVKWDDPKRVSNHRELYIDIGALNDEDVTGMGVRVGQPISYGTELKKVGPENAPKAMGKALDDRAGTALLIDLISKLKKDKNERGDVYLAFTVQEEVGLRGASVVAAKIKPDFAIAVDTTPTSDTYDVIMTGTRRLGGGPCIKLADKSLISHPLVSQHLFNVAKEKGIPFQEEIFMGIGTDAGAIHMTGEGIATGGVSIPSRYTHSPHEVIDLKDLTDTGQLLLGFITSLKHLKGKGFLDT